MPERDRILASSRPVHPNLPQSGGQILLKKNAALVDARKGVLRSRRARAKRQPVAVGRAARSPWRDLDLIHHSHPTQWMCDQLGAIGPATKAAKCRSQRLTIPGRETTVLVTARPAAQSQHRAELFFVARDAKLCRREKSRAAFAGRERGQAEDGNRRNREADAWRSARDEGLIRPVADRRARVGRARRRASTRPAGAGEGAWRSFLSRRLCGSASND